MKCDEDAREARLQAQKDAQKRVADKEKRLKELEQEKQDAMLKAASRKK